MRDLSHEVFEQVTDQMLGVFVVLHALVHFNLDHLRQLVGHLLLLASSSFNLHAHSVSDLCEFSSHVDFLLRTGHLFLSEPAIDSLDLGIKVSLQLLEYLVLASELLAHIVVKLCLTVTHFIQTMPILFLNHLISHLCLIPSLFDLPRTLVLLLEQPVDQIGDFNLELVLHVLLHTIEHTAELVIVLQVGHLQAAQVVLVSLLLGVE